MKKLLIAAWTIFIIGSVFRLMNLEGYSILSIIGTLLLLIHSLVFLIKNAKTDLPTSLVHLSYSFLTTYILLRLQYWPVGPPFFLIVLLLAISCFVLLFKRKIQFKFPQIFLVVYFIFSFVLSFTDTDKIYYFFHLNTVLNGESRNTNYYSWDKYSWFLYLSNKQDEAIEANQKAQKAAEESLKVNQDKEDIQYLTLIKLHGQQIQNKSWTNYP